MGNSHPDEALVSRVFPQAFEVRPGSIAANCIAMTIRLGRMISAQIPICSNRTIPTNSQFWSRR